MKTIQHMCVVVALVCTVVIVVGCAAPQRQGAAATANATPIQSPLPPYPPPSSPAPTATATVNPMQPPTGIPPAPLPTLDASRVTWVPTRTPVPGTATPTATTIVIPTQVPWTLVTPSAQWQTYSDPGFNFSFEYPANWYIDLPSGPHSPSLPEGTEITIRNFDNSVMRKGTPPSGYLAIQITLLPEFTQSGTIENWLAQQKQQVASMPEISYSPTEGLTVSNVPALRYTITAPMSPDGVIQVALGKGKWIYLISAYPANSPTIHIFHSVVAGFRIP